MGRRNDSKPLKPKTDPTEGTDAAIIRESLRPYAIADKLRTLRLRRSMGLAQLAEHTGFSPAMLSRLENGRLIPTLPTLTRIALVFSVGLDYFFSDPRKRHTVAVVRRNERKIFPSDPKSARVPWHFESLDFRVNDRKLNGYLAHFHSLPQDELEPHYHPGVELLYLIEGELEISIGVETIQLSAGDAIYFDSMQKHTYRSLVDSSCTAMVITTGAQR
ncbi:helix-turn-helix domain-containing protein [Acidobacteria bacterium AB60]|nr:helix-turn-helix domain-containing protein [Acidobacteria bacterium AB60]